MNTPHRPGRGSFIARFLSVILGLVTLTVLYGCLGGGGTGSGATGTGNPEETAKIEKSVTLFLTTLQSGNSAQLNALFSPRLQALEGATTFAPLLIRSFGSDMSASADDELFTFFLETSKIVYLSSSQARLPAHTQFADGQRLQLIFTLSRDSDVWLIDFIEAEMLTESVSLLSEDPVNSSAIWPLGPLNRWLFAETTASTTSSPDEMRFRQLSLSSLKKITTEGLEYYEMADSVYTGTIGKTNAVFGLAPDALGFGKSADSPGFTDAGFFPIYPATASPDLWTLLDPARDGTFQLANALGLWLKMPGAQSSAPWWKLTSLIAVPGAQFTQTVELTDSKGLRQDVELKVMVMRPVLQTLPWVTARAARLDISSRVVHTGETGFATVLFVPGMGPTAYGQYDTSSRRLSRIGYLVEADVNGRAYRSTSTPTPTPELLAVVSTQPLDNATGVASLTPVIVTFDASLEPTSVAGQVTAVASGVFLAGEITASGTQLAFLRPDGWPAGERVDVTIGTGVRSLTGLTLPASYTFGFTVEAVAIPPSAPLITAFSPTTATASGPATLSITGTGFLASATFRLTLAGQTPLMSVVSTNTADLATVTFSLTGVTAGDWLLEIGNTDGGSNIASTPFAITAPPTTELLAVVTTQPLDNATGVASLTPVIVTFDASLEPTSVTGQVTAVASGVFLAGEITASGTQLEFLRPDGWPTGARVDLTIGTGVRSLTGLTLPASYTFGFTVETVAIPPSAPLITAFSPTTATASGPATLSVTGTGFLASATFRLTLAGQTPLMSVVSTNTADLATVTFSLTGVTAGDWLLEIGNTDGGSNIASTPFTITAPPPPAPLVTAVSPTSATNTATILLTVSGDNFYGAPTVRLSHATLATLTAIPSTVTPTSLAVTFDLAGVPSGTRMLTVANPDGQVSSNSIPFSVNDPIPPAIASSYSPLSARGETTTTVTVIGANLAATTSIRLVATGQADIPGTSVTVSGDTYLTATFNLTGAATGSWNLVLFNPGSFDVVASTPFTVAWPLPVLSSVTPTSAPNTGITNLAITGSFFQWGMNSALIGPGGERIDTIYPWNNALNGATFTCSFDLAGKPLQTMSVYLITPDGASNTVPLSFTVRGLASPTVTHIVPDHRPVSYDSGNLTPDLYGSDFVSGAVVQFYVPGATDTPTVYFNSSQNLHVAFTPSATPPATYSVRVINPNGDVATLPGTFLLETPPPLPVITTITPNTVWNDAGNVIFQLDGADFVATPYVDMEFVYPSQTYTVGVEARNVTFESPTRLSVTLDMSGREPGDWSLRLRNPYGYPANIATITVLASAPAITSITPASGYSNQNVAVTIVGTNLFNQPTISLASASQPTIPATSVSCSTPTRVDCTFELSSYTPAPGTWDLVYTDFKGQTTTGTFQILAPLP